MGKALRDEAVVRLPRISNNAGHGGLRLARRVKSFQAVRPFFKVTNCIAARCVSIHVKALISFLLRHLLKRFHAMFGLELPQDKVKHQRNPVGEELRPRGSHRLCSVGIFHQPVCQYRTDNGDRFGIQEFFGALFKQQRTLGGEIVIGIVEEQQ